MADLTKVNHYMQTPVWADVKERSGFEVREVEVNTLSYGELKLHLYIKNVPIMGRFAYAPMWPNIFREDDMTAVKSELQKAASDCFMVRFEPAVPKAELYTLAMKQQGLISTGNHVQYLSTLIIDLDKPAEDVLMSFHKTARYDIKMASQKFGVSCEELPVNDKTIAEFTDINLQTKQRKQYYLRDKSFLQDYWKSFAESGQGHLYAARHEGKIIAMSYVIVNGKKAYYKDAGSVPNNTGAASALQWFAIQQLIKKGVKSYDLCGALANGREDSSDPLWGVYKFKNKFSKDLVTYPGFIDLPLKKLNYGLWRRNEHFVTSSVRKLTGEIFY